MPNCCELYVDVNRFSQKEREQFSSTGEMMSEIAGSDSLSSPRQFLFRYTFHCALFHVKHLINRVQNVCVCLIHYSLIRSWIYMVFFPQAKKNPHSIFIKCLFSAGRRIRGESSLDQSWWDEGVGRGFQSFTAK